VNLNWADVFLWGFAATTFLTTALSASQSLGWTRMSITFMLGTMWTPHRDRAKVIGFVIHFLNGWLFAILYAFFFEATREATWWWGGLIGLVHGLVVLLTLLPLLPGIHPRMVSEFAGPDPTPMLEPPGFLALNYGIGTPLATLVAHVGYGIILGHFYDVA
jgi:hypothetical protein